MKHFLLPLECLTHSSVTSAEKNKALIVCLIETHFIIFIIVVKV